MKKSGKRTCYLIDIKNEKRYDYRNINTGLSRGPFADPELNREQENRRWE